MSSRWSVPRRSRLGEVDDRAFQRSSSDFGGARLMQALYLARREALEEIISTRLINDEAKARGIDAATLIEQEISSHAPAPTENDIAFWYQTNPARVQNATLPQVHDAIKSLLVEQRMAEAHDAFIGKLKDKVAVTISLEPPRQKVDVAGHPDKGPEGRTDRVDRVFRFSVPVLPACESDGRTGAEDVRQPDSLRLPPLPVTEPSQRAAGSRGGRLRRRTRALLAVPRRTLRQPGQAG